MSEENIETPLDKATCDAILDTAKTIYNEESERFKQVETKTSITLAFVGVLFGIYLTYLGSFKPPTHETSFLIYTYLLQAAIFTCLTLSILYFLQSIRTGEYEQVSLQNIIDLNFARESEGQAKLEIAATYRDAVLANKNGIDLKMKLYSKGLNYMIGGFILFALHFIVEEVTKHVH